MNEQPPKELDLKRTVVSLILLMVMVISTSLVAPSSAWADPDTTNCLYPSPTDRFGVTVFGEEEISWYDVSPLTIGRYLNWRSDLSPQHPNGMYYYFIIRTSETGHWPAGEFLQTIVRSNSGATWIIGNEADVVWQDNTSPAAYARAYHDAYTTIKSTDPTARVVANGIVQVSPLRLAWLEQVWTIYRATYGADMPVDAWNIHTYVANEMHQEWGFEVPPGIENAVGYTVRLGTQWTQVAMSGASGGTVHASRTVDAKAYFAFRGDQVTITLRTGPDSGIAQIFLDRATMPAAVVDLYAANPGSLSRTFSNLAPPGGVLQDRHHIRVRVTGSKNPASSSTWVRVDSIAAPSTANLANGRLEDNDPLRATIVTSVNDHDNLTLITQQIRDFRQWMLDHDQRSKPLINTEYGILMTQDVGFDYTRVRTFMLNSFNRFLNDLVDPNLGYPDDGNRLLQEWFWFALAVDRFENRINNSGLYSQATRAIKPLGNDFVNYIRPRHVSYADLELSALTVTPYGPIFAGGEGILRIEPQVRNRGNSASGTFSVIAKDGGGATIVSWPVAGLPRRFQPGYNTTLQHDWAVPMSGQYSVRVIVDEADQVPEPCGSNNEALAEVTWPQETDLALTNLRTSPALLPAVRPGTTATITLQADLLNLGAIGTSASQVEVKLWHGDPNAGGELIGVQTLTAGNIPSPATITFQWPDRSAGRYEIYARVEPVPDEINVQNNSQQINLLVPGSSLFFPISARRTTARSWLDAPSPAGILLPDAEAGEDLPRSEQ